MIRVAPLFAASTSWAADAALAIALKNGDRAGALALLEQKTDVNAAEADGTSPLHWAVYQNDVELVDRLIAAGANVNAMNSYGSSPMSWPTSLRPVRLPSLSSMPSGPWTTLVAGRAGSRS